MNTNESMKKLVKEKYTEIANQLTPASSCCCCGPAEDKVYNIMTDDYSELEGYNPDADLGLGCGIPTQFAQIRPGQTVLDLGSGAGNDCFVARHETGPEGKVIGIDFSEAMIRKARENVVKLGYNNVEFRYGDIEALPVADAEVDVVVSNCVLNLVPEKQNVFAEIFRSLKPGGHFSISDIVLQGELPAEIKNVAELYAGCVTGAIQKEDYLRFVEEAGFREISVQKEKVIDLPDEILKQYLTDEVIRIFRNSQTGINSITVFARKPA